jgi:hypothetical protein
MSLAKRFYHLQKVQKKVHVITFGFGEAICPKCYSGEERFLFYDDTYWLNRIFMKISLTN